MWLPPLKKNKNKKKTTPPKSGVSCTFPMDGQTWNSSTDVDGSREKERKSQESVSLSVCVCVCVLGIPSTRSSREKHRQPLRYHMEVDGVVSIDPNVLPIVVVPAGVATRRMYAITFTSLSLVLYSLLQLLLSVSVWRSLSRLLLLPVCVQSPLLRD